MRIFEDVSEDSEIRINAYLAIMKCVDYHTILRIKDLLNIEEINQGTASKSSSYRFAQTAFSVKFGLIQF